MRREKRTPPAGTEGIQKAPGKRSIKGYQERLQEARLALAAGISVLPPRKNGSKAPILQPIPEWCEHPDCVADRAAGKRFGWKHRQHRRAGESILRRWYEGERQLGIGLVCGKISDGLLLLEFEGRAVDGGTFDDFLDLAEEIGLGELIESIREGYEEESPSGGIHWLVQTDDPRTEKLASTATGKPLIETKGEGGYAIVAPTDGSVHPSGRPWRRRQGGFDTIVEVSEDELDAIFALARKFDQKLCQESKPPKVSSKKGTSLPGDDFNERAGLAEIIEAHGWEYVSTSSDSWELWRRPGKDHGISASITPDGQLFHVFSSSTPFEANKSYGKFYVYAALNHSSSDGSIKWHDAANALRQKGYGGPASFRPEGALVLTCMTDVHETQTEWLWQERIPFGNLSIIAGDPGTGKSTLSIDLGARASKGRNMPFTPGDGYPISVLLLTAEDGVANTVKPRLAAANADMSRVYTIDGSLGDAGVVELISIPDDIPTIRDAIISTGARLMIIDPLDAFFADRVDSYRNQSVRRALSPLKMLAEETGVAIVAICHLNKNSNGSALYRVSGSIGNTGAARSVLLVSPDPADDGRRILAGVKANLSPLPKSLAFELDEREDEEVVHVGWTGFSDLTKDDLIVMPKERNSARKVARAFLEEILSEGPKPVNEIETQAKENGISMRTVRRASEDIGILKQHIDPPGGHWEWSLPDVTDDE